MWRRWRRRRRRRHGSRTWRRRRRRRRRRSARGGGGGDREWQRGCPSWCATCGRRVSAKPCGACGARAEAGGGKGRPAKRAEADRLRAEEAQARAAERARGRATRLRARRRRAVEAAAAAAPAARGDGVRVSGALHERLLEGKMLLDEEMATLRLEAAKAPEGGGGRAQVARRANGGEARDRAFELGGIANALICGINFRRHRARGARRAEEGAAVVRAMLKANRSAGAPIALPATELAVEQRADHL